MEEKPTMESPTKVEGKPVQAVTTKSDEEIQSLLSTLEKVGVKSPQHLEGIAQNAREFGTVSNLLGQERQRALELERRLRELESRPPQRATESYDLSQHDNAAPVDLEGVIAKVVRKENEARDTRAMEIQKQRLQAWNAITSDPDYETVRPIWEEKLKDPNFVWQINAGAVDPIREYDKTVREFLRGVAMQSKTVIEQFKGKTPVAPPHMESGERGQGNLVSEGPKEMPEPLRRLNELKQKASKGGILSTDEELELARIATFGLFPTSPAPPPKRK